MLCSRIVLSLAWTAAFAGSAGASITEDMLAANKAAAKAMKVAVTAELAAQDDELSAIEDAVKTAQTTTQDALEQTGDALGAHAAAVVAKASKVTADAAAATAAALAGNGILFSVRGSLAGDGGSGDQLVRKIDQQLARYRDKTLARLKTHEKRLANASGGLWRFNFVIPPMHVYGAPRANSPDSIGPTDNNVWSMRILFLISGGTTAANDGQVELGVLGQTLCVSTKMNIRLHGPTGNDLDHNNIDFGGTDGIVRRGFDTLREGNHFVFVEQSDVGTAADLEFPVEFGVIGVP